MFDEMFPGMGMMGAYGMYPGMVNPYMGAMFGGMPQYGKPGADVFSNLGIMSPQQQMFQSVEMQNMMEQQQFARQQQMLAMQNMQMNMGAQAAQVGSGFAGPMLMQMGGLRPAWSGALTNGINAGINMYQNGQPSGLPADAQGAAGMVPMGPNAAASQQIDPTQLLTQGLHQFNGDPAKAQLWAGQQLYQLAQKLPDGAQKENLLMQSARMLQAGNTVQRSEAAQAAGTAKQQAQAAEASARAKSVNAEMYMPKSLGTVHNAQGETGIAISQIDPKTGKPVIKTMGWGIPIQYQIPNTPGGMQENITSYQKTLQSSAGAIANIDRLDKLVASGAPIGLVQDGTSIANDAIGIVKQLFPNSSVDPSVQQYMQGKFGSTFQGWATKGELGESTASQLVMALASSYAGGRQVSKNDIQRAVSIVGESIDNPSSFRAVLADVRQRTIQEVDRQGEIYGASGTAPYQQSINNLRQRFHQMIQYPNGVMPAGAANTPTPAAPMAPGKTVDLGNGWTVTPH